MPSTLNRSVARSLLLLTSGTLLGAAIGGILFLHDWLGDPHYKASMDFQVLSPPWHISGEHTVNLEQLADHFHQVLNRQVMVCEQKELLTAILNSYDFHPADPADPAIHHDCQWLQDNKQHPIEALRRDFRIETNPDAASFKLTMRARDPKEAAALLVAACGTYLSFIEAQGNQIKNAEVARFDEPLRQAEQRFAAASAALQQDFDNNIANARPDKEQLIKSVDPGVTAYQEKVHDLKELQDQLNKIRAQREIAFASCDSDDRCIQQLRIMPETPDSPAAPDWRPYIPFGAGGGFLVAGMLAVGLAGRKAKTV